MKKIPAMLMLVLLFSGMTWPQTGRNAFYITNQPPLAVQPFTPLPLGAIKPKGMLMKMLELQRDGLTGHLDSIYSVVCGPTNGWLGGTGDGWERGPYWLDGLVPLAYILNDTRLKAKAQQWIEWSIQHQRADGYFGPEPLPDGYKVIPGTQQGNREDWWPKMVMLKVLQQYYMATGDKRVINLLTRYFHYQLATLPKFPLDHWTFWGERRGGDNLAIVYWLYNITGDKFLLDLAELIHKQTFDWTAVFSGNVIRAVTPPANLHGVNITQGLKEPLIYSQQHPDRQYADAVKMGLSALHDGYGFVNGMFGADEHLHSNDPTQGSELCSAVEMMYSFESVLPVTGDVYYADYLEKLAYNVLPAQVSDDFTRRQYFQQANQVVVNRTERNFLDYRSTGILFGVTTGYPCCLTNMHQGWPKFIQNLWYATADNGIAALLYGPSEVTARVAEGQFVTLTEETDYPFREDIHFTIHVKSLLRFQFHLRIPLWCNNPVIQVNGEDSRVVIQNNIAVIDRQWNDGDRVELHLPMKFRFSRWAENAVGIERGPLVYALKIGEVWHEIKDPDYPDTYWEVLPNSPWNYILDQKELDKGNLKVEMPEHIVNNPWNPAGAPIMVKVKASRMPSWQLEKNSAGKVASFTDTPWKTEQKDTTVTLIPYGCTTLRISQFPTQ